jgi:hypothetical protein
MTGQADGSKAIVDHQKVARAHFVHVLVMRLVAGCALDLPIVELDSGVRRGAGDWLKANGWLVERSTPMFPVLDNGLCTALVTACEL